METSALTSAPSVVWHIVWQLTAGHDLLATPALADRIRSRLIAAHRQPGRELLHYLLTPTEIHLLSRLSVEVSPADIARSIGSIVARWVREATGVYGVVFAARFHAHAIESDDAARDEIRMLAWRPVTLGLSKAPTHHAASSLRTTLGLHRIDGFNLLLPLRLFGEGVVGPRDALRTLIARRPGSVELRQWELARGMALARIDAKTFSSARRSLGGLAAGLVATSRTQDIEGALLLLERWVHSKLGLHGGDDASAPRSSTSARLHALVGILAVRLDLCSAAAVARHFHRAKATLSERMAACRRSADDQRILGVPLRRIVDETIKLEPAVTRLRTTR
jgi:hypothetical protein